MGEKMNRDLILPTIRIPGWLKGAEIKTVEKEAIALIVEKRHDIHDFLHGIEVTRGRDAAIAAAIAIIVVNESIHKGEDYDCYSYVEEAGGFPSKEERRCCPAHSRLGVK